MERFKSGKLPLRAPNKAYANSLIKGLVEGEQLSEAEAIAYIEGAAKSLWLLYFRHKFVQILDNSTLTFSASTTF